MKGIHKFNTIDEYNKTMNIETRHPLVSVINFENTSHSGEYPEGHSFGYYTIVLKDAMCGDMKYGRNYYDYQEGTLVFLAPDRMLRLKTVNLIRPREGPFLFTLTLSEEPTMEKV